MQIVLLTTSLAGGGAEFVARTWAEWLATHGHDVRVLTTSESRVADLPGVRMTRLSGRLHVGIVRALRRELAREPADAVVSLQNYPNLVALAALVGRRHRPAVVVSERNITTREGEPSSIGDRAKQWLAHRLYRRADLVIGVSHAVAAELVSAYGVPGAKIAVVPNPAGRAAELRAQRGDTPSEQNPSASLSTGADLEEQPPLHIVLPMRLVPQKRASLAVAAAAVLRTQGTDARLICFSRGDAVAALQAEAEAVGVPFAVGGWSGDWAAAAPANSVAVLPSYREGFGNVLVEAALGGIPSAAVSNAYGVADSLVPGVTGDLALVGTPDALARAIRRASTVSMVHVPSWAKRFSTDESGRLLVACIDRALSRRKVSS